jgi:hypothetical protein
MQSPVFIQVTWLHLSSLSMVLATMNAQKFSCFPSVTSTTKRTATNNAPSTKPTPWMVLSLAIPHFECSHGIIPYNQQYYEPDIYHINPYSLPTSVYPDIKYDGGLSCYLLHDENLHMEEKYPPGTQIE